MSGIVLPALVMIGVLPIHLQISYEHGELSLRSRIFFVPVPIVGKEHGSRFGKELFFRLENLLSRSTGKIFLKNAYTTLKRLAPRLWIPYLKLHILTAGNDPANAAMVYGITGTVFARLRSISCPRIHKLDLWTGVDFQRSRPEILARAQVSLYLYQVLWSGLCFAWGFWRDQRKQRKRSMITDE